MLQLFIDKHYYYTNICCYWIATVYQCYVIFALCQMIVIAAGMQMGILLLYAYHFIVDHLYDAKRCASSQCKWRWYIG